MGSAVRSPAGPGRARPTNFWVHFELKTALLVIASLKSIFRKPNCQLVTVLK